jgi:hypothetical protein
MVLAHMLRLLSFKFNLQVTHIAQQMNHVKPDGEIAIVMMTALETLFVDKETTLNLFQDSLVLMFQPKTTQMVMMITAMIQMPLMKEVKDGLMLGTLLMLNGTQSVSKDHMETPGISLVKKISMAVKFAKTTSLLLMLTVTLAQATMMPTQMVAVITTLKNSSLLENAASVEVEAPETIALENSPGICISPMMKLMVML